MKPMGALVAPTPTRKLLRRNISIIIAMIVDIVEAVWVLVTRPAWLGSWSAARRRGVGAAVCIMVQVQSLMLMRLAIRGKSGKIAQIGYFLSVY